MKVCIFTLGCKVNQYESDVLTGMLKARGYDVSEKLEYADYYIINSCAVTSEAEKKSRQCVARAKKQNPDAKILVCGCAAENNPLQFKKEGVTYISGTGRKDILAELPDSGVNVCDIPRVFEDYGFSKSPRTRAYIKIQDGCNNFCTYCLIPYVRGRSRSRRPDSILKEIDSLIDKTNEIVLTGIDISSYGKDIGLNLASLIGMLSNYDIRIRLGSFEVNIIDDELLTALKGLKRFCPHFHLSLQSGSDTVLRSMNRHYTTEKYIEKVNLIRNYFPMAGVTTDVIVGFPTETDEEFEKSVAFIEQAAFADIHCFPYSPRKGTKSYGMRNFPPDIVDSRTARLLQLKAILKKNFAQKNLGVPHEVLFEDRENGYTAGYTENYIKFYSADAVGGECVKKTAGRLFLDGIN